MMSLLRCIGASLSVGTLAAGLLGCSSSVELAPVPPYPGLRLGARENGLLVEESDGITFQQAPFSLAAHDWITAELECSDWLNEAHYNQDMSTGAQVSSAAHFENCDFSGALAFIQAEVAAAKAAAKARKRRDALMALGRAMHALQDFYAHSNYVELMEVEHPDDPGAVAPLQLWTAAGRAKIAELERGMLGGRWLVSGRALVSGVAWWSAPERCPEGTMRHAGLAKDSLDMDNGAVKSPPRWGGTRFHTARELAQAETMAFLRDTVGSWPELEGTCGNAVAFVTLIDQRKEKKR